MNEQIAIMRRCVRCKDLRSIDDYLPNGKMCQPCVTWSHRGKGPTTNRVGVVRGLVMTDRGKELLAEMAKESLTAA